MDTNHLIYLPFLLASFACSSADNNPEIVQGDGNQEEMPSSLEPGDTPRTPTIELDDQELQGTPSSQELGIETQCDGIDNDGNGLVDDVDVGNDGFCDCLTIGIVGRAGANNSDSFQGWLEERGSTVTRFAEESVEGRLAAEDLEQFDVLFLDWVSGDVTEEDISAIKSYVETGGGLLSLTGYTNDYVDAGTRNELLGEFSAGYDLNSGYLSATPPQFLEHVLTDGVEQVAFHGGLPVFGPEAAEVFAEDSDGRPIGLALQHDGGRILLWGDEWITFDSEWKSLPGVETLWRNAMTYLGPQDTCQVPLPILR